MKFRTSLVSANTKGAGRPCSVIRAHDKKVLATFETRKSCAVALGLDSPMVSLLIYGSTGKKLVDNVHGELNIVDGIREKPSVKRSIAP